MARLDTGPGSTSSVGGRATGSTVAPGGVGLGDRVRQARFSRSRTRWTVFVTPGQTRGGAVSRGGSFSEPGTTEWSDPNVEAAASLSRSTRVDGRRSHAAVAVAPTSGVGHFRDGPFQPTRSTGRNDRSDERVDLVCFGFASTPHDPPE
jgi:hypothetical protein